jgi:hypothetical protein
VSPVVTGIVKEFASLTVYDILLFIFTVISDAAPDSMIASHPFSAIVPLPFLFVINISEFE